MVNSSFRIHQTKMVYCQEMKQLQFSDTMPNIFILKNESSHPLLITKDLMKNSVWYGTENLIVEAGDIGVLEYDRGQSAIYIYGYYDADAEIEQNFILSTLYESFVSESYILSLINNAVNKTIKQVKESNGAISTIIKGNEATLTDAATLTIPNAYYINYIHNTGSEKIDLHFGDCYIYVAAGEVVNDIYLVKDPTDAADAVISVTDETGTATFEYCILTV